MRETIRFQRPDQAELKEMMSNEQYDVMVNGGTEKPFSSHYIENGKEGLFVDAVTGEPLFTSYDKFDSGTGWPSFVNPISKEAVKELNHVDEGDDRTEVRSGVGDFHLGHVFDDGPKDRGGKRYCINGVALRFIPVEDLEKDGYGYLLPEMHERKKYEPHKN